ncbi:MAG: hypothetical protein ABFS41_08385 [Myxococcota bacterium]
MSRPLLRLLAAFLPLLLVPAFGFLIAEGHLDLGGGDKDIVWVFPYAAWSLLYALSSVVLWVRGWPLSAAARRSALVAVLGVLAGGVALAAFGQLGVGGRF